MLLKAQPDEDLMALYQDGSEEAFRVIYERHSSKIYGYLKSRTRSEQLASDLTQEVFIKIHKSKHLYNRSLPVLPWIFSITSSVMIDGFRKMGRNKEVLDLDLDRFAAETEELKESQVILAPLLETLPENQQLALQMRYVDEKTFEEIAQRLKTNPVNVRQLISRGIKQLKMIVKGEK